ncbi:MAG: hypothetical protein MUP16_10005 [Sedimentisphaerales bacterium]|nr:hypothetical protein [Sedimentisphaerales bacterium]
MATVNKRVYHPQAMTINTVAVGGIMTVAVQEGYENIVRSSPDGLQGPPIVDRECQFCRGTIVVQDWIDAVLLLLGTIGTCIFYERISGVAATTGYTMHTLTNPVIHTITLTFNKGGYATVSANFECKANDETETIADMHAMTDTHAAPTYVPASRGGWRIISAVLGAINIYHLTGFTFTITLPLVKACKDEDIAYTAVDARLDGLTATGLINFQDSEITASQLKVQQLLLASAEDLIITVVQSPGTGNKVITIANIIFTGDGENYDVNAEFTGYSANYEVNNDPAAPLTLGTAPKILTIA